MGIFSTDVETRLKLVSLISTESEVDGVIVNITTQTFDGPYPIDEKKVKRVNLNFNEEVTI